MKLMKTHKDRKTFFTILTFRRVLSAFALLIILPVFFFGCDQARHDGTGSIYYDIKDSGTALPVRLLSKGGTVKGDVDIFVFNDDALGRLDSYQRFLYDGTEDINTASRKGHKIIAAAVNAGKDMSGWSGINSFDGLKTTVIELRKEDPSHPAMCGTAIADMGDSPECDVVLTPMLSEIHISSIRCDFSGKPYAGETLSDVRFYLINVNGMAELFRDGGFVPMSIVNAGALSETDMADMKHPDMLLRTIDEDIGSSPVNADCSLYCYPNESEEESAGSPFTRLVIEGRLGEELYYYPINVNRSDGGGGIGRNCRYSYDIVLTRSGTKDPDIPADPTMVQIRSKVQPWYELDEDEIVF